MSDQELSRPDKFVTAEQIARLRELMDKWRAARDSGQRLPQDEQSELEAIIQAELQGTIERGKDMADRGMFENRECLESKAPPSTGR